METPEYRKSQPSRGEVFNNANCVYDI
jgi:hypothetical protein